MKCVRRCLAVYGLSLLLSGVAMSAQVGEVKVVATSGKIAQDRLETLVKHAISTRVGSEFSPSVVSEDIKKLVKSGNFEDIQTNFSQMADGRVSVTFSVAPKPMVTKISFQGNTQYTENSLRRLAKHETGIPLDEGQLSKDRIAILDRYRNGGYYGTEVQTTRQVTDDGVVENPVVVKSLCPSCDEEALRIVNLLRYDKVRNRGIRLKMNTKLNINFHLAPAPATSTITYTYTPSPRKSGGGKTGKSSGGYSYSISW